MNSARKVLPLAQCFARNMSKSASSGEVIEVVGSRWKNVKEFQKKCQIEDGVPVHLKAGLRDSIMYQSSLFLTGVCGVWALYSLVSMMYKK